MHTTGPTRTSGVDVQVLSAAPQLPYADDVTRAIAAARYVNDEFAAVVDTHPDRFLAFAATAMPHIDASLAELARALDELGMVGLTMTTSVANRAISDPDFEPVFAELDRRAAPCYICTHAVTAHARRWSRSIT
jgi:predicted TIM-barrel fold metal-dependent hydrolase